MPFCINCGHEIKEGDQYCIGCGQKVNATPTRQQSETALRKCPNCGEVLPTFAINCTACGFELRDIKTSSSEVAAFLNKLNGLGEGKNGARRRAEYIRAFSVPNDRDSMFEFLTHAAANIDTRLMKNASTQAGMKSSEYKAQILLTEAWLKKYEEVYNKAEKLYGNDQTFQQIKYIHDNKLTDLKSAKRAYRWANSSLRSCFLLFIAATLVLGAFVFAGILIFRALVK